ncbi:MAG TPA: hypothetical protein VK629_03330 [Steroidobacteraceae bacterium]|nr:hypothetical protein [Steroidobacteraceae bacterium]
MRIKVAMGLACAVLLSGTAQACDYWRDQAGTIRGTCKLEQATGGLYMLDLDLEFIEQRPPRYRFKLANLQIRRLRFTTLGGNDFEIFADVRNVDAGNAPTAPILVMVDILVAGTATQQSGFQPRTIAIPALAANTEQRVSFGAFTLPDRKLDWDVAVTAVVDPPSAQRATGVVYESNETDNALNDLCRIYGAQPNLAGPRACL